MKFIGWTFTVLVCFLVIGFFADWVDLSKHDGVVSLHVNTVNISRDIKFTCDYITQGTKGLVTKEFQ